MSTRAVCWTEHYEPFWIDNGTRLSENEIKKVYFPFGGLVCSLTDYIRKVQVANYYLNQKIEFQHTLILILTLMLVIVLSLSIIYGLFIKS